MTRNLKVLGLAMSAVWAVSAQAADPEFHCTSTTNTCTITGTEQSTHTFTVEGGSLRCRSATHATLNAKTVSTISGAVTEQNECRAFGVASTVSMNGCTYTDNNVAASSPATATVSIVCPEGKSIVISSPSLPCTINIGAQTSLAHAVFNNSGGAEPTHVIKNLTVTGIRYTKVQETCPRRSGTFNTGTTNGETTLEAFNDDANTREGNQVGFHVKPL